MSGDSKKKNCLYNFLYCILKLIQYIKKSVLQNVIFHDKIVSSKEIHRNTTHYKKERVRKMKKEEMTKAMIIEALAQHDIKANQKMKKDELFALLTEAEEAEKKQIEEAELEFADTCTLQEISEECKEAEIENTEEVTETAEAETVQKQKRAKKMTAKELINELAFIREYNDRITFKVLKTDDIAVKLDNKRIFRYIASSRQLSTARIEYMSDVNDDVKLIKTATKVKARCDATRDNIITVLATAEVFA